MSETAPRLSLTSLSDARDAEMPGYDPATVDVGIVHLGIGAFSRAHVAVYTDAALERGDKIWGICGISQRSRTVPDQLAPQDGIYSVLVRGVDAPPRIKVVGAVREVLCAADDPEAVVARIAALSTHVVTLTVTEKGYRYDPGTKGLRSDEDLQADVAGGPPRTVVGQIVRGLQRRRHNGGPPIAVMSCDNLTGNGSLLRGLVHNFVARLPRAEGEPLAAWIDETVAFPSTMVDRIVPATTDDDRDETERLLGLRDEAVIVAEPFSQWVIEDAFTGPRPAWEQVGATLTDDVESYERVKLRLLNAAHSLIAYLGVLVGYETIAEAVGDELILGAARELLDLDQIPTVSPPDGVNLEVYRDEVLHRFTNPALGHRTTQVAMDGSQKIPQRLLGAVRERRAEEVVPTRAALLVAAWMRALGGKADDGSRIDIDDPLRERVAGLLGSQRPARDVTQDVLAITEVFGDDLAGDRAFGDAVASWYAAISEHGVRHALVSSMPSLRRKLRAAPLQAGFR